LLVSIAGAELMINIPVLVVVVTRPPKSPPSVHSSVEWRGSGWLALHPWAPYKGELCLDE
jgi:hypothetical protein